MTGPYTALVLAGSRDDTDPVAAAAGKSHKALVDVAGVPMLARVLETLAASAPVARVVLCIEPAAELSAIPAGDWVRAASAPSPARSVLAALDAEPEAGPWLVVTADHPLLTPAMIEHFARQAAGRDLAVALAPARCVRDAYPEAVRTWLEFRGGAWCGCNLFALNTPAARRVVARWTTLEGARKRPWRLIRALGPLALLRYRAGRLTLDAALGLLSRRLGADVGAVSMPFAEAAIDVDKPADLALAERILRAREGNAG